MTSLVPRLACLLLVLAAAMAGPSPLRAQLAVHDPTFSGSAQSDLDLGGHRLVHGVIDWSLLGGVPTTLGSLGIASVPWSMVAGYPTPAQRGMDREVWIAVRTDGVAGAGTPENPFDGSTQPKFDALMAGFGTYTTIHLLPGVFLTKGWNTINYGGGTPAGWTVKTGWKIVGAGRGVTTLRQIAPDAVPFDGYKFAVIGTLYAAQTDFVEVRNLTVDCNGNVLAATVGHSPLEGVFLTGSYCHIDNVEVVGAWGTQAGPLSECFPVYISAPDHGPAGTVVCGNIIESSVVRANSTVAGGGYVTDFSMGGEFDSTGAFTLKNVGGVIRNCQALGVTFVGYQSNGSTNCLIQGNYAEGSGGYGQDSFNTTGLMLVDNAFHVTVTGGTGIGLNPASGTSYAFSDYTVARNTILLDASGVIGVNIAGGGSGNNLRIAGNHIVQVSGTGNTAIQVNNAAFTNVWIEGNVSGLANAFPAASASVKVGNNISGGTYVPDANMPLLNQSNTFSSGNRITGGSLSIATQSLTEAKGQILFVDSTAAADSKVWDLLLFENGDGVLRGRAVNDAASNATDWLEVYRSGFNPTYVAFPNSRVVMGSSTDDGSSRLQVNGPVSLNGVKILTGPGVPAVAALVGSLYLRTDGGAGSTLYVKESGTGTTGWAAK